MLGELNQGIDMNREVMIKALNVIKDSVINTDFPLTNKLADAIYAIDLELSKELEAQLAQPEQEPVRWFQQFGDAPPKREWVGLTDDEKESVYKHADAENHQLSKVVSAVEWLLKNKNTT